MRKKDARGRLNRPAMAGLAGLAGLIAAGCTGTANGGGGLSQSATSSGGPAPVTSATSAPAGTGSAPSAGCQAKQDKFEPGLYSFGPHALTGVQFVSPERGWVVGLDRLLMTSDGGRTWTVQASGHLNLISVDFLSADVGWAVGSSALLATTDGGAHWTALPEPCPVIRSVHFLSATDGLAIAGGTDLGANASFGEPLNSGVLLRTHDGGRTWQPSPAPADAQSVCFSSPGNGWLGAGGKLYRSSDNGRSWNLAEAGALAHPGGATETYTMTVQCAGPDAAWAEQAGSSGAMSQDPHIGFAAGPDGVTPLFAEQYFPHPGVTVTTDSPGSYPGPMSVLSPAAAIFVDWCPACAGQGTAPWAMASMPGPVLRRLGVVGGISQAEAAAFLSPEQGWVTGVLVTGGAGRFTYDQRVMATLNGGLTWRVAYHVTWVRNDPVPASSRRPSAGGATG